MVLTRRIVSTTAFGWLLASSLAHGHEPIGRDWTYQTDPMGEELRICTAGMPSSGSDRVRDGGAAWDFARFGFTFGTNACLAGALSADFDDVNQVNFGPLGSQILAEMVLWYRPADADILECDLMFNSKVSWYAGTSNVPTGKFDFWSVVVHEMGHCLGLGHSDDPTAVMFETLESGTRKRSLREDDENGRNAIY